MGCDPWPFLLLLSAFFVYLAMGLSMAFFLAIQEDESTMIAIECKDVYKAFKSKQTTVGAKTGFFRRVPKKSVAAVNRVSFTVNKGEIFGILGPNGSGKSTLIRLISTLLLPDEGTITVFGKDVVRHPLEVRRMINRVSVEAAFFKKLSAIENLTYAARLYNVPVKQAQSRIKEILQRLSFEEDKLYCPLEELSRGMQQKVAIARAFFTSPMLMLLDEPTTGLDPSSKRDVQEFIRQIQRENDTTMVLTTHDMQEAEKLCQRIAIIHNGVFVALDTPENLKNSLDRPGATLEDVFFALSGADFKEEMRSDVV